MSGNQSSRLCARLGRSIPDVAIDCEPAPGAHLVTQRSGYEHHGIYAGAGRVVHYAGFADGHCRGPVVEVTLDCFGAGNAIAIQQQLRSRSPEKQAGLPAFTYGFLEFIPGYFKLASGSRVL